MKIATLKTAFVLTASLLLSAPVEAAPGLQAPAFLLNQPLPNTVVQVIEYKPPFSTAPRKTVLSKAVVGPAVLVYVIPGNAPSEAAALDLLNKTSKGWRKVKPVIVMRGMTDPEIAQGVKWVESNKIAAPVIIDSSMEVALGLQALQVPSYALVDADGKLKIRKFENLDKRTHEGASLREVIAAAEAGKSMPLSDGSMREDTRSLVGQKVAKQSFDPAPYSPIKTKVDIGPGVRSKPTLVVFWLATCPHCQKEMPKIHQWWQKNKANVELVTITRTDSEQIRNYTTSYMSKQGVSDLPVYAATPAAYEAFKIEGIPTWAMLSPDGTIVKANVGEDHALFMNLDAALAAAKK